MSRAIRDHAFRGEHACLMPVTVHDRFGGSEQEVCSQPETAHRNSVNEPVLVPGHRFLGLRRCAGCGLGFDHVAHYFSPSRLRLVGLH